MVLRHGLAQVINLGGTLLLTKTIGPAAYGLYAGAFGIQTYLFNLSQWGIGVYLVRQEKEGEVEVYHQATTLLLLLGILTVLATGLLSPLLERWLRLQDFGALALALFVGIPLRLLALVPTARLERQLDYRQVSVIGVAGQVLYYVVALPMAWSGMGAWSAIGGWWAHQLLLLVLLYRAARYRPSFHWDKSLAQKMMGYGLGYSASTWVWQLRELVSPLVVGRFAGAEAMGYIVLAVKMVRGLGFVMTATWRISMAAFARIQNDFARMLAGISEGMRLQVLALGPLLLGFGWIAPWLLPHFDPEWLPVIEVFPFIALGYLAYAMFSLHTSALYVLKENWSVTVFHAVHILLFAGSACVLVPRLGLLGYGLAEAIALLSYAVIHTYLVRKIGRPDYQVAGIWWLAFALALFWQYLGWWTALGLVGILAWPKTWQQLKGYLQYLKVAVHER
jgi:PST family polysaccharide transporter